MEHGADIDKPNRYNSYPLAEAANYNDFEAVLYLLEAGADYKLAEYGGISFFVRIRQVGDLMKKNEGPIRRLVDRKKFDAVRAWLEDRGVDVGGK